MPEPQTTTPLTFSFAAAADRLGVPQKAISQMVESGELKTVILPSQRRPKILGSSVEGAFRKIYGDQQQTA